MTSRERIHAAIDHKEPDQVPIDLGGSTVTGISASAYSGLLDALGLDKEVLVFDTVQQLAHVDDEIIDLFNVDCLDVNRILTMEEDGWYDIEVAGGINVKFPGWFKPITDKEGNFHTIDSQNRIMSRMPAGSSCFDQTIFPWESGLPDDFTKLKEVFKSINWFEHSHNNYINIDDSDLRAKVLKTRESTDKAIVMSGGVKILETGFKNLYTS